jgi:hypothetical protein
MGVPCGIIYHFHSHTGWGEWVRTAGEYTTFIFIRVGEWVCRVGEYTTFIVIRGGGMGVVEYTTFIVIRDGGNGCGLRENIPLS